MSKLSLFTGVLAIAAASWAIAQNPNQERAGQKAQDKSGQITTDRPGQIDASQYRKSDGHAGDSPIATCLTLGNQSEVAISRLATEKAKNEKVKQFAQEMVAVHSQAASQLQRFAGKDFKGLDDVSSAQTRTGVGDRDRTATDDTPPIRDATRQPGKEGQAPRQPGKQPEAATQPGIRPGERSATASVESRDAQAGQDKMMEIGREIAQKCLALTKAELSKHSEGFDQAYLGQQVCAHIGMLAMLETYQQHASPELGQLIQKSHTMAQDHLRKANDLIKELAGQSPTATRSTSPTKTR